MGRRILVVVVSLGIVTAACGADEVETYFEKLRDVTTTYVADVAELPAGRLGVATQPRDACGQVLVLLRLPTGRSLDTHLGLLGFDPVNGAGRLALAYVSSDSSDGSLTITVCRPSAESVSRSRIASTKNASHLRSLLGAQGDRTRLDPRLEEHRR